MAIPTWNANIAEFEDIEYFFKRVKWNNERGKDNIRDLQRLKTMLEAYIVKLQNS